MNNKKEFLKGFYIGFLFFSFHLFWFLQLLLKHGKNFWGIPFWFITTSWFSLLAGICFWLQYFLYQKYKTDKGFFISCTVATVLFFYIITYWSLFPCGICEGYPFFNPLVWLAYCPPLLWSLKYLGFMGVLTLFVAFVFCTIFGFLQSKVYFIYALFCMVPFLMGFLYYQEHHICWSDSCFIKPWWYQNKNPMYVGYRMVHNVTQIMHTQKNVQTIIMPESSFGWDIYEYQQFIEMMCDYSEDVTILFGTQRRIDGQLHNSYCMIRGGHIVFIYDKQHLVPLMERIPRFLDSLYCGELLCYKQDVFEYGSRKQDDVIEINGIKFQLFVCSELLYEAKVIKGLPILFVCNDAWFTSNFVKKWMLLFMKYIELLYDVPVVYGTVEGLTNIQTYIC